MIRHGESILFLCVANARFRTAHDTIRGLLQTLEK